MTHTNEMQLLNFSIATSFGTTFATDHNFCIPSFDWPLFCVGCFSAVRPPQLLDSVAPLTTSTTFHVVPTAKILLFYRLSLSLSEGGTCVVPRHHNHTQSRSHTQTRAPPIAFFLPSPLGSFKSFVNDIAHILVSRVGA